MEWFLVIKSVVTLIVGVVVVVVVGLVGSPEMEVASLASDGCYTRNDTVRYTPIPEELALLTDLLYLRLTMSH